MKDKGISLDIYQHSLKILSFTNKTKIHNCIIYWQQKNNSIPTRKLWMEGKLPIITNLILPDNFI